MFKFRTMSGNIPALLLVLALLSSVATSCRGGKTTTGITSPPVTSPVSSTGQGTLNLADSGPITLDPATAAEVGSASYIVQIFSGLARLDQDMKVVPDIAQSWDKSVDGVTYTFHLRRDVKFHDGAPVKASDFKYSWERALNPATQSLTAGTYLNDIVGAGDVLTGKTAQLSGVQVVDDYTLSVKIDAPKAYFLNKMAYPTAFVVEKSNVQSGSQWWQKPVGTGPFKLKQWVKDQTIVLARNPDFYGEKAKLEEVVFALNAGNSINLYQTNEVDVTGVGGAYLALATDPANPVSSELTRYPELSFSYLGFNSSIAPFDDVNVRLAFTYAVDREKLTTLAAMNNVTTAYGILPPGMPGYNSGLQAPHFDPVKARQLLAASKYGGAAKLPLITLTTAGYGGGISGVLGGMIDDWRRNLGVEVVVRQLEPDQYYYALNAEKDSMFDTGWIADYPDPQNFLDVLFRTGNQNNYGGYGNPQLDVLLDRAATDQDSTRRMQEYQQAEQMIVNDAAVLPLFFGRSYVLVKPWVSGYALSPLGLAMLNRVSVGLKPPTGGTAR